MRHGALLAIAAIAFACGSGKETPAALDPDVPRWVGGCFLEASPGKIINGSASSDVRSFGDACAPGGAGGLIYLDRFDPVSGDGDVTVLSSASGSRPVVVAPHGGGASIQIGSTGARVDSGGTRLLTLANVTFVTGTLVEAPLPAGAPTRAIGSRVRVDNYDFAGEGGVLYVGNYDAKARTGDIFYAGPTSQLVASAVSRFDFLMYRLAPDRRSVAYLLDWNEDEGGDLLVQTLPPGPNPSPVAHSVFRMAWSSDGHLIFRTVNADRIGYALWSWDGSSAPVQLSPDAESASVLDNDVLYTTGWSVLEQRVSLHLTPVTGGADLLGGAGPASLQVTLSRPPGTGGVLAYFVVPDVTVATEGDLHVTRLSTFTPRPIDSGVTIAAGVGVSPRAGFVSYALGFAAPQGAGSANPQPGIAQLLKVAPVDAGAPLLLAQDASTFVAWDPLERFVAGAGEFQPAVNRGTLVVRSLSDGASLLSIAEVGNAQFGFAADGSFFWAIRNWDDAQQRGQLVVAASTGGDAWKPIVVADDVTWVGPATGGRAIYGVRGGRKDGIWSAAVQ